MADAIFFVQVEPNATGVTPKAKSAAFTEITGKTLQEVGEVIHRVAEHLAASVKKDELSPSELTVEFGIGLKGDASIPFLAKGSVETNFKVTAKWTWEEGE